MKPQRLLIKPAHFFVLCVGGLFAVGSDIAWSYDNSLFMMNYGDSLISEQLTFASDQYEYVISTRPSNPPADYIAVGLPNLGYANITLVPHNRQYYVDNFYSYVNRDEDAFYHSTCPACLVGFSKPDTLQLAWQEDRRYEYIDSSKQISYYNVYRSTGGPGFSLMTSVAANTDSLWSVSWADTNVSAGNTYIYKVMSLTAGDTLLAYSWPCTVEFKPDSLKSVFWPTHAKIDTIQYLGDSGKWLRTRFLFDSYRASSVNSVWLEVDTLQLKYFKEYDTSERIALTFEDGIADVTIYTLEYLQDQPSPVNVRRWYGGYPFRIAYTYDGSNIHYYPKLGSAYAENHDHSFTTNVNNRVHSPVFWSYLTDKSNTTARDLFIQVMVLGDEPNGDEVGILPYGYENLFVDSATPKLMWYQIDVLPVGLASYTNDFQQTYHSAMENAFDELNTAVNNYDPAAMIIHNGTGVHQTISYLAETEGAMIEHFGSQDNQRQTGCSWLNKIHATLDAQETYTTSPRSYYLLSTADVADTLSRIYSLASYFLVKDANTLLDIQRINGPQLYPEMLLSMGARVTNLSSSDFYSSGCTVSYQDSWEDLQDVPPDKSGDSPHVCEFDEGWTAINYEKDTSVDFPSALADSVLYTLRVDTFTLLEGGRIWSDLANPEEPIPAGTALILLKDNVYSPVVEDTAIYPLFADDNEWSKLAVRASQWNGEQLAFLDVDMNPVGIQDTLTLKDDGSGLDEVGNDGIYTYPDSIEVSSSLTYGTYALPTHAQGSDGLEVYSSVIANVVPIPVAKYERRAKETTNLGYPGSPYSAVTVDYNTDGEMDMLVSLKDEEGRAYKWINEAADGTPMFQEDYNAFGDNQPIMGTRGLAVADYDNDGLPDIFAAHDSIPRLYRNEGGTFVDELSERISPSYWAEQSFVGIWGDYNRDSKVDLLIVGSTYDGQDPSPEALFGKSGTLVMLLKNEMDDSTGQFVRADTVAFDDAPNMHSITALWGDVNDDGLMDLFIGNLGTNESRLYLNDGPNESQGNKYTFHNATSAWFGTGPTVVSAACWIDYDRDGKQDLAVARMTAADGKHVQLYRNTGSSFSKQKMMKKGFMLIGEDQVGIAALDFDLNGYQDLVVLPEENDQEIGIYANSLYQGGVRFAHVSRICDIRQGAANGLALADYNLDGDLDLFLGRLSSADSVYAQNVSRGTGGDPVYKWIGLKLHGDWDCNNSYGIGAKVKVIYGANEAIQFVDGGSGRGGQMPWPLLFGLGSYEGSTVNVEITWPNGTEQTETCAVESYVDIYDQTGPQIDTGSVFGSYQTGPEQTDWYFDWDTAHFCYAAKDTVKISSSSGGNECPCGEPVALTESRSDVDLEITENPGGGYHHRLTWYERCCVPNCRYYFSVHSGTEYATDQADSTGYFLKTKTCLGP